MLRLFIVLFATQISISYGFKIQPRVVNGKLSNVDEYPFFVVIDQPDVPDFCSSTLINDRFVLTAAHCIKKVFSLFLHLGMQPNGKTQQTIQVNDAGMHIHPHYDAHTNYNDIALVELPTPIKFTERIQPIALPKTCVDTSKAGLSVIVAGVGVSYLAKDSSEEDIIDGLIHQTTLTTYERSEYENLLDHNGDNVASVILANSEDGSAAAGGDSGGPLILEEDGTLIGVTSTDLAAIYRLQLDDSDEDDDTVDVTSSNGARIGKGTKFMRLPYYFDWISEVTGLDLPDCKEIKSAC